jgi:hypothetical protein
VSYWYCTVKSSNLWKVRLRKFHDKITRVFVGIPLKMWVVILVKKWVSSITTCCKERNCIDSLNPTFFITHECVWVISARFYLDYQALASKEDLNRLPAWTTTITYGSTKITVVANSPWKPCLPVSCNWGVNRYSYANVFCIHYILCQCHTA